MWSILVVDIPIRLEYLQVLLTPAVAKKPSGDTLVFKVHVEETDIDGAPKLIDDVVIAAVNAALAKREIEWDFTKTLTHNVPLPELLDPVESLSIHVPGGKLRIEADALVLAVSFKLAWNRGSAAPA